MQLLKQNGLLLCGKSTCFLVIQNISFAQLVGTSITSFWEKLLMMIDCVKLPPSSLASANVVHLRIHLQFVPTLILSHTVSHMAGDETRSNFLSRS